MAARLLAPLVLCLCVLSGPGLAAALIRGLASTGLDVVDLGPVTTPMLYYVAARRGRYGCHSGIQDTGSHNPKDYNGFKMVLAGRATYGDEIVKLRRRIKVSGSASGKLCHEHHALRLNHIDPHFGG